MPEMGRSINKTYFITPLIYVAIIFGLLFLQFAKRGEKFFDSYKDLSLLGKTAVPQGEPKKPAQISELHVRFRGIDFSFGPRQTAELANGTGEATKLLPLSYKKTEKGFSLLLSQDVAVNFSLDEKKDSLSIQPVLGKGAQKAKALSFQFAVVDGARANSVERMPILSVNYKDKNYFLSLPGKSAIDMGRQQLILPADGGLYISFVPSAGGTKETFRQWYANQGSTTTDDLLTKKVTDYLTGAYQGWQSGRYAAVDGTWITEKGVQAFKESLVNAYLAEALRRGDYLPAQEEMQKAAGLHPDSLTFSTCAFLGNLQNLSDRLLQEDEETSAKLAGLVRARDASVFARGDLVQFSLDRGSQGLAAEVQKFASDVDVAAVSLPVALGMLQNYYDTPNLDVSVTTSMERFPSLINAKIFPGIVKLKEGFFLETEPGKIDVLFSVLAGKVLMKAGKTDKDPVLESIGRDLVLSALDLSDKYGFLPRYIVTENQTFKANEGRIAPEDIYPHVTANPYYPRFISLSKSLGPGNWIYITAKIDDISITPALYKFNFQFPEGATHHFVFRGAKPYQEIQIWGVTWRIDPNFERYAAGAFFNEAKRIISIKYRHKKTQEEFFMRFE